jgi:UDP:flavonoid glycosyltransferase YjiC (YdhE family)
VPMPLIKTWEKVDPKIIAKREEQVLGAINAALALCDLKPVKSVADMLKANGEYVTMFEELDHYQDRAKIEGKPVKYLGKFYATENGQEISWNKKADKRVMAYIRPENPGFVQCMSAFTKLSKHREIDIIVSAPGLPEHIRKASERANLRIVAGPVKLGPLLKDCDLGIDHASQGIACAFALNGIPQLLLPGYLEQLSFARALGRNKLGRGVVGRFGPEKINELMNVLLTDPQYTESARAFAKKYKGFKPDKLADQIAEDITLLAQKGS